jgi:hypothetical protein
MVREKLWQWLVPFLIATAVTVFASYTSNDKATEARLSVVETAQGLDRASQALDRSVYDSRMNRLEQKIDLVLNVLLTR